MSEAKVIQINISGPVQSGKSAILASIKTVLESYDYCGAIMNMEIYEVVTDGKVYRITERSRGGDPVFVGIPEPLEFKTQEAAEDYRHKWLSTNGWKPV